MALNLYRRHGSHCSGGRALHDMTYETDEVRRSWKKCSCPIYASGTLNRQFKRKNTERVVWADAKASWPRGRLRVHGMEFRSRWNPRSQGRQLRMLLHLESALPKR